MQRYTSEKPKLWTTKRGQSIVEYAMIIAMVAVVVVVTVSSLGGSSNRVLQNADNALTTPMNKNKGSSRVLFDPPSGKRNWIEEPIYTNTTSKIGTSVETPAMSGFSSQTTNTTNRSETN